MRSFHIFRYLIPHRRVLLLYVCSQIFNSTIVLILPLVARLIVNSILVTESAARLNSYSLTFLILLPLLGISIYYQDYWHNFLNDRMIAHLRMDVFHHMLELPLGFFSQHRRGALISRVISDIMFVQGTLMASTVELLRQVIYIAGGVFLMLSLNWKFALMTLASLPLMLPIILVFSKRIRDLATKVQDETAKLTTVTEETLAGIKEVKAYTQESYEQKRFTSIIEARFNTILQLTGVRALFYALIVTTTSAISVLLLWFGGYEALQGRLTPGDLVAIFFYMGIILGPAKEIANKYSKLQEATGASRKVFEILNSEQEKDHENSIDILNFEGRVVFDKVSFQYPDSSQMTLQNITFTAEPGMLIAIVGRNGSGKTTLANLIPRFYDALKGSIRIDDHPISQIKLSCLRSHIGIMPQETYLFGGTIAENIAYSCPGISEDHIIKAAKSAFAHQFIMKMPQQYNTVIGDRGIKLSAGQRQRIAIARLFLKDCRIIILDEATSSLDSESERIVNKAIDNLLKNRTGFTITHKLSSIQMANLILVLENGEIVERGVHNQLLEMNGIYKMLYDMNSKFSKSVSP